MSTRILTGDCRELLPTLPPHSVHACVTSPPYLGLRDYGTAQWDGGDAACDHQARATASAKTGLIYGRNGSPAAAMQARDQTFMPYRDTCGKCGAVRVDRQIGLEGSLDAYITALVEVFREVKRALRDDGSLWLVLGDSYASAWPCNRRNVLGNGSMPNGKREARPPRLPGGLKEKDLMMVPARVALALQADGWYLRSDIIWAKKAPMPESVTDRPTSAHEHVFLLTKKAHYFYDAEAVKEDGAEPARQRFERIGGSNGHTVRHSEGGIIGASSSRNLRNVWHLGPAPFSGVHFATFPPALVEPCIKAGCPVGGTVLDPFAGAGTVGLVADRLGRNSILIELNPEYAAMAKARIVDDCPMFTTVTSS